MKKNSIRVLVIFLAVILCLVLTACGRKEQKSILMIEDAITQAFFQKKEQSIDKEIVFVLFDIEIDHIQVTDDEKTAEIWFAMLDRQTGVREATEPGVALAFLVSENPYSPDSWKIVLHHDEEWQKALFSMPESLMSAADKALLQGKTQSIPHDAKTFTGYKLPWPQGRALKLSGSIAHVFIYKTCPTTCLYAFDFWDGTMFPVSAARGGVVKKAVWEYPNGNTTNTNYILIEDTSTTPTTYQIYYHLAQDSIPTALRTPGAVVTQGQFIGNADDTGASTAHHLHFMVHTNPNSYWGTSVDITFDEVSVNGGRPRTCNEANLYPEYGSQCISGDWYVSQNTATQPPSVKWLTPTANTTVTSQKVMVSAQAASSVGIQSLTFFFRQGTQSWQTFAAYQNSAIAAADLDFCQWGITDGKVDLAVEAVDVLGKKTDTKNTPLTINKSYTCQNLPVTPCTPAPDQIALFTDVYYQGACAIVPIGSYPSMDYIAGIDNDRVRSILVGNDALGILFTSTNLKGAQESFQFSDPDLSDNPTGLDTVSSVQVFNYPDAPQILTLPSELVLAETDTVTFTWQGDAESYRAEIFRGDTLLYSRDWGAETRWVLGYLEPGQYRLHVSGKNIAGMIEASTVITIQKARNNQPQTQLQPLPVITQSNLIHLTWEVIQGEKNVSRFEIEVRENEGEWCVIAPTQSAEVRNFDYLGNPGTSYQFRMRALALDGASEEMPAIAQTQTTTAVYCSPDAFDAAPVNDNDPVTATAAVWFTPQNHNICGQGDVDWIQFSAKQGQRLTLSLHTLSPGFVIAGQLFGDADLVTPIAHFTEQLVFKAPADGTYYLMLQAQDPAIAGTNTHYQIRIQPAGFLTTVLLLISTAIGILSSGSVIVFGKSRKIRSQIKSFIKKVKIPGTNHHSPLI